MLNIAHSYIDGRFVPTAGDEIVEIVNPANEAVIGRARLASREDVRAAIDAAAKAQPAANAAASLLAIVPAAAFQGAKSPATPTGSMRSVEMPSAPAGRSKT